MKLLINAGDRILESRSHASRANPALGRDLPLPDAGRSFGACFVHDRSWTNSQLDRDRAKIAKRNHLDWSDVVARGGVEPLTFRFSGLRCSVRFRSAPSVAYARAVSR
jgi:hypothetical protein